MSTQISITRLPLTVRIGSCESSSTASATLMDARLIRCRMVCFYLKVGSIDGSPLMQLPEHLPTTCVIHRMALWAMCRVWPIGAKCIWPMLLSVPVTRTRERLPSAVRPVIFLSYGPQMRELVKNGWTVSEPLRNATRWPWGRLRCHRAKVLLLRTLWELPGNSFSRRSNGNDFTYKFSYAIIV